MSFPSELDPDRLYMFVFGPGKGESIALRVPPNHWIVIDSCKLMKKAAAKHVLDLYRGELSCIILTHPHNDHYRYFSELLSLGNWLVIGCNDLRLDDDWSRTPITARANELEQIVAEIRRRWKGAPSSIWWTWRRTTRRIGEGELLCLHPEEGFARANPGAQENLLSSATLFTWNSVKVVLGADVVHPHWQAICEEFRERALEEHATLKVAHHASENGVYPGLLTGTGQRFWITTPYNSSHIPNFADNHGPDLLLRQQDVFYLTGLPTAHSAQAPWPCEATRAELQAGTVPGRLDFTLSKGLSGIVLPKYILAEPNCYAIVSAARDGTWRIEALGPGSVRVKR